MSDLTATQKASAMYNRAKNIASGKIDLEVSGETVMGIIFLGFIYMIISSIGMNIYSKCDAMKGQPVQENLNKYKLKKRQEILHQHLMYLQEPQCLRQ